MDGLALLRKGTCSNVFGLNAANFPPCRIQLIPTQLISQKTLSHHLAIFVAPFLAWVDFRRLCCEPLDRNRGVEALEVDTQQRVIKALRSLV